VRDVVFGLVGIHALERSGNLLRRLLPTQQGQHDTPGDTAHIELGRRLGCGAARSLLAPCSFILAITIRSSGLQRPSLILVCDGKPAARLRAAEQAARAEGLTPVVAWLLNALSSATEAPPAPRQVRLVPARGRHRAAARPQTQRRSARRPTASRLPPSGLRQPLSAGPHFFDPRSSSRRPLSSGMVLLAKLVSSRRCVP
jgi:hypothetical protein